MFEPSDDLIDPRRRLYSREPFCAVCRRPESETHAPPPPADTILNEIGSGAAWQNAGAEAVDLAVEQDVVLVANLGGLDEALVILGMVSSSKSMDAQWTHEGAKRCAMEWVRW